jgi:hypothetical protein
MTTESKLDHIISESEAVLKADLVPPHLLDRLVQVYVLAYLRRIANRARDGIAP